MKEFVQSLSSFALSMPFLGLQVAEELVTPLWRGDTRSITKTLNAVVDGTTAELGSTLRATFHVADDIQKVVTGVVFDLLWTPGPTRRAHVHQVRPGSATMTEIDTVVCPAAHDTYVRDEVTQPIVVESHIVRNGAGPEAKAARKVTVVTRRKGKAA